MQNLSVFSKHLIQRFLLCKRAELRRSPTSDELDEWITEDTIRNLHKQLCNSHYDPYLVLHPYIHQTLFDPVDPDTTLYNRCSYLVCTIEELRKDVVTWSIDKVIANFDSLTPDSIGVYMRILTDKLNRLYYKKYITKEENIYMRDHLIENILGFRNDYKLFELPF